MEEFISVVRSQFSNRELATATWLLIFFIWAVRNKPVRRSLKAMAKALGNRVIITTLFLMGTYICIMIFLLRFFGLWSASDHLKTTAVWAFTVAFGLVINISNAMRSEQFFKKTILDTVRLTVFLEFFVNLYPFSLLAEFLMVPAFVLVGGILAIIEIDQRFTNLKGLMQWVATLLGFALFWHAIRSLLSNPEILNAELLVDFLLPSVLTVIFLPFIYMLALGLAYSTLFFRLEFQNRNSRLLGYAKRTAFVYFGFSQRRLNTWLVANRLLKFNDKEEVLKLFRIGEASP